MKFLKLKIKVPLLRLDSHLCPVGAFARALQLVGPGSCVPAFVFKEGSSIRWLTKSIFVDTFREIMKARGMGNTGLTQVIPSDGAVPRGPFGRGFLGSSFRFAGIGLVMLIRFTWNSACRTSWILPLYFVGVCLDDLS